MLRDVRIGETVCFRAWQGATHKHATGVPPMIRAFSRVRAIRSDAEGPGPRALASALSRVRATRDAPRPR
ncbi:hypothetical protein B5F40_08200 [Gordonibacter sp. An230]|nr:hypothetical protein B5F40_08200 [Gordonibacter sp. An230]